MKKFLIGSVFVLSLTIMFAIGSVSQAHAANLTGWAWTDTFGWLSFNSTDSGAGGNSYNVAIDTSGNWRGYAWSPNIGWVSFNSSDVSPCGSAGILNKSSGAVSGWARAIAYGGTYGCIELSGTNHTSPKTDGTGGITYDSSTGIFKGYAWGGDLATQNGLGWIQFNPTGISNPVTCRSTDCGYSGVNSGTCSAVTAYQNISPNSSVTFQANPTSGTAPYTYAWNPPPSVYTAPNQYTASYANSAPGPNVVIKDADGIVTSTVSCPAVTVLVPLTSSALQIGRTVATANSNSLTIKQSNPFALTWNFTLSSDYSCSANVTPDPNNSIWNSNWKNLSLGVTDNGDGTKTWSGNTATNLKAGTSGSPVAAGIYQFGISCTSSAKPNPGAPQNVSATLKVDSSQVQEI